MKDKVERVRVSAYSVPTDGQESDGTLAWQRTVLVTVEVSSGGATGLGYTYADSATAKLIESSLAAVVLGQPVCAVSASYHALIQAVRNLGRDGIAALGVSAIDTALWDLKAKLLGLPLVELLGPERDSVALYGSGGFTSYDDARLESQLAGWSEREFPAVKMKVGRDVERDVARVRCARAAIGERCQLFVDANGAYSRKQALSIARRFADLGVNWFEEPVSSDDLPGLSLLVERMPPEIEVAAGEYGYQPLYFERMLGARAVDVLQADVTRCGGITGFCAVDALCELHQIPLSCHCAPALHAHLGCACRSVRHVEYFHDHARIESQFFDGVSEPRQGRLVPDRKRLGSGLELRRVDVRRFLVAEATRENGT